MSELEAFLKQVDVDGIADAVSKDMYRHEVQDDLLDSMTGGQRDLVEYYKHKCESFERERDEYIQKVMAMEGTRNDYYKIKWELVRKEEETQELQKALSDAHIFLYDEREQVLKLSAENDELRIQELEDRKRIQHLLALTQPVSQEVTYFRDCRPSKISRNFSPHDRQAITKNGTGNGNSHANARVTSSSSTAASISRALIDPDASADDSDFCRTTGLRSKSQSVLRLRGRGKRDGGKTISKGGGDQSIVRTIYMPNESVDVLKLIIQSLRTQLEEQKTFSEQRCQALMEDRLIREMETKSVVGDKKKVQDEFQSEIKQLLEVQQNNQRDFMEAETRMQKKEKSLLEQIARLEGELERAQRTVENVEMLKKESEGEKTDSSEQFIQLFRQQALGSEEDLAIVKAQYEAAHALYEKRIKYQEAKIHAMKKKYAQLETRRALEMEGFRTDIGQLRNKMRDFERLLIHMTVLTPEGDLRELIESGASPAVSLSAAVSVAARSAATPSSSARAIRFGNDLGNGRDSRRHPVSGLSNGHRVGYRQDILNFGGQFDSLRSSVAAIDDRMADA